MMLYDVFAVCDLDGSHTVSKDDLLAIGKMRRTAGHTAGGWDEGRDGGKFAVMVGDGDDEVATLYIVIIALYGLKRWRGGRTTHHACCVYVCTVYMGERRGLFVCCLPVCVCVWRAPSVPHPSFNPLFEPISIYMQLHTHDPLPPSPSVSLCLPLCVDSDFASRVRGSFQKGGCLNPL